MMYKIRFTCPRESACLGGIFLGETLEWQDLKFLGKVRISKFQVILRVSIVFFSFLRV